MPATRNFGDVIRRWLSEDPDLAAAVEREAFNSQIAGEIYNARKNAGLTQKQLAERAGTHQSVVARLEDADYDGHSLSMLWRIAEALGMRLRVEFFPTPDYSVMSTQTTTIMSDTLDWPPNEEREGLDPQFEGSIH